ncbi:MAG: hypothetical protein ABFS46_12035 [Myxococcota bacterium]
MPEAEGADPLEGLVEQVLASRKYRRLLPEFVAGVGSRELSRARRPADAVRATRSRLHQSVGAFRKGASYTEMAGELSRAAGMGQLREVASRAMRFHASTEERFPILEAFYARVFDGRPVRRVLDLACGLHPLGIPWMPVARDLEYLACDVDLEILELVNGFLGAAGVSGRAFAWDLLRGAPEETADVAFLLKSLPCLERLAAGAGLRVLREVRAPLVFVSFPSAGLSGRRRGMGAHHGAAFRERVAGEPWRVEAFELPGELVFRVEKSGAG